MNSSIKKVRAVPKDACLGILASGSPVEPSRLQEAYAELSARGFQVSAPLDPAREYGKYEYGFSNGSPEQRAAAFMELIEDDEVAAVLTARGGYGTLDILPLLDFEKIAAAGKLVIGMSDVTALLVQCVSKSGIPAIHGPAAATAFPDSAKSEDARRSADSLVELLQDPGHRYRSSARVLREGSGQGKIIAGNLTMFTALLGTPWDIDYDGCVLVLEEVGDAPFQVHRSFMQLKLAGKLDSLAALVLGRFSRCDALHGPSVEDVIRIVVDDILAAGFPVLDGLPFGHWGENVALPLGCVARVEGGVFEVLESPLM